MTLRTVHKVKLSWMIAISLDAGFAHTDPLGSQKHAFNAHLSARSRSFICGDEWKILHIKLYNLCFTFWPLPFFVTVMQFLVGKAYSFLHPGRPLPPSARVHRHTHKGVKPDFSPIFNSKNKVCNSWRKNCRYSACHHPSVSITVSL